MPTFKDITDDRELCDQYWEAGLLWYVFPDYDGRVPPDGWELDVFSIQLNEEEWQHERPSNRRYSRIKYAILLED